MKMDVIDKITTKQLNPNLPEFRVGDTVILGCVIEETRNGKTKERVQDFEGVVISRKNKGVSETVTVRKVVSGVGVEKTYPIHSPKLAYIKVTKKGKVRRAKLYFLRDRVSQFKIKERR